jgi:hypothetical protein
MPPALTEAEMSQGLNYSKPELVSISERTRRSFLAALCLQRVFGHFEALFLVEMPISRRPVVATV